MKTFLVLPSIALGVSLVRAYAVIDDPNNPPHQTEEGQYGCVEMLSEIFIDGALMSDHCADIMIAKDILIRQKVNVRVSNNASNIFSPASLITCSVQLSGSIP